MLPFQDPGFPTAQSPSRTTPQLQLQRVMKSITNAQVTVQRSLASTREYDVRFLAAQERANDSARTYLNSHSGESDAERLRQVRAEQRSALILADKKVRVVGEAHDLVDRQIERLDAVLNQLQDEFGPMGGLPGAHGQPHEMRSGYLVYSWMCEK